MRRAGLTQADLRQELDLSTGVVGRWLRGDRKPQRHWRKALHARFGIPLTAWERKPAKKFSLDEAA
jgi:ribosome-binding protein aMBF1 (putative translation factor)